MIYNKKGEKNKIINISVDKDKDIEGYVNIHNKINDNAIEKKKFSNLKDDVLKLIGNSCIYDVKRKGCKIIKKKIVMLKEKAVRKIIIIKKKIVMIAKMLIIMMIIMIMIAKMIMIMIMII